MTDHLEPYRRMARSIRFVPPQWQVERCYQALTQVNTGTPTFASSGVTASSPAASSASTSIPDLGATPDPSEYSAALIQAAVSKPTAWLTHYNIPENIGDRISKLATPQPKTAIAPLPKLPEPDPNWTPAPKVAAVEPEAISETVAFNLAVPDSEISLPEPEFISSVAPVPAIASEPSPSEMGDLEIVLSTAEPATRLEIPQPTVSPSIGALETTPDTASKATKQSNRKQAQGFSPSKKRKA
ncbi:MAG TPA: hypothetical protein V6C63_07560 [Allocoleopsis sp.]